MLRDSCLYSSLACSVYSYLLGFSFSFFSSFEITCRYLFIIWHKRQLTLCDLFCWIYLCILFFLIHMEGERLIHGGWICGRVYSWIQRDVFFFGATQPSCAMSLNVTCSEWSFVEVVALFHNADVAVTSSGLWFWTYGRVCSFYCCLPRWSQVLHGHFLLYISDSVVCLKFWLTNHLL